MKLINVTNSHSTLIKNQLESTAANLVKIYTLGKTTITHADYHTFAKLSIKNELRNIQNQEADYIVARFKQKLNDQHYDFNRSSYKETAGLIEIEIPKKTTSFYN